MSTNKIVGPKHIAIIPDGNRRWAIAHNKNPYEGHQTAVEQTIDLALKSENLGVKYLTLWGFSTENWKRSQEEVQYLMNLFYRGLKKVKKKFLEHHVGFKAIGRMDRIPKKLADLMTEIEAVTQEFTDTIVCIAIDYGGRDEILRAVNRAIEMGKEITEEMFSNLLDTKGIPDPDMIIRTGGEKRFSGFLPWQGVYAELFFVDEPYPEMSIEKLRELIDEFNQRTRTFGGTSQKKGYEKYK